MPLTCTSLGKALLAFSSGEVVAVALRSALPRPTAYSIQSRQVFQSQLAQTRVNHLAYDREESQLGVLQVACPILVGSRAVAAVSVAGSAVTFDPRRVSRDLMSAAARIAADLADDAATA
jgi:DNA-binding IclR family transcriptional regulator